MAWLSGYSKRIKLTVDNTNVDTTLFDFPVLIKISNNSGISSTDVTFVFTELGSDANRKKIAVTTFDGETQYYVEIERFDYSNSIAWFWVKVPSVSSGAETVLYLYYDSTQTDNTTYIGDTGDTPAQNVWDTNFKLVMHMAQDPNGDVADAIKDSTSNANHGTPGGSMTTADLVDGKVGKGIDFDGSNDYINIPSRPCSSEADVTFESTVKIISINGSSCVCLYRENDKGWNGHGLEFVVGDSTLKLGLTQSDGYPPVPPVITSSDTVTLASWYFFAGVYSRGTDGMVYINGVEKGRTTQTSSTVVSDYNGKIAWYDNSTGTEDWNDIEISEFRISNTARSAAWIKATYYSNWDELVSFGTEELIIPESVQGCCYNTWTNDPFIYKATISGINVYNLETTLLLNVIEHDYVSSVWANDDYVYVATSTSGIYRCETSTVTETVYLDPYKQYPDITSNYVYCIHGHGDYLCATTASGIDHYNLTTGSGICTTLFGVSKCFQTARGEFYYTYNPSGADKELHVVYDNTNNWDSETVGHIYTIGDYDINDLYMTEKTSRYGNGNVLFIATISGVVVIEEKPGDEENNNFKYYYLNT